MAATTGAAIEGMPEFIEMNRVMNGPMSMNSGNSMPGRTFPALNVRAFPYSSSPPAIFAAVNDTSPHTMSIIRFEIKIALGMLVLGFSDSQLNPLTREGPEAPWMTRTVAMRRPAPPPRKYDGDETEKAPASSFVNPKITYTRSAAPAARVSFFWTLTIALIPKRFMTNAIVVKTIPARFALTEGKTDFKYSPIALAPMPRLRNIGSHHRAYMPPICSPSVFVTRA